jgi:palmitoyltransferase
MTKIVDKAMWGIGPVFIAIAVFLIDMCALGYYMVVLPFNYPWVDSTIANKFMTVLNFLFTIYMVYCIHFHYYMAIKTPPGDMEDYRRSDRPNNDVSDINDTFHVMVLMNIFYKGTGYA